MMKPKLQPGALLQMLRGGGAGARKAMKAAGMKVAGKRRKAPAPEKQELGLALKKSGKKMKGKKMKGATCMKCKGGHATAMHGKMAKKKIASK